MIDTHQSGIVRRYLLTGPHEDKLAVLEIERSELVAAIDFETGEEIPLDDISQEDFENAIGSLIHRI